MPPGHYLAVGIADGPPSAPTAASSPSLPQLQISLPSKQARDLKFSCATPVPDRPPRSLASQEPKRLGSKLSMPPTDRRVKIRQFPPTGDMSRLWFSERIHGQGPLRFCSTILVRE